MKELTFGLPGSSPVSLKSTLISLVPFPISEFKPGLCPGQFDVSASENGRPSCKVIDQAFYYVYIDKDRGSLRVVDPSYKLAAAICLDYNQSQLGARPECHPGFYWKLGEFTTEQIEKEHAEELAAYRSIQMNWFIELVKMADDDWEKTRQHYSISDVQRYALKSIDPTNSRMRPWLIVNPLLQANEQESAAKSIICPACASDIIASAVMCRYCRCIIDQKRYSEMSFADPSSIGGIDLEKVMRRQ